MKKGNEYWRALQRRDNGFDHKFYYGVATTGIYCVASCKTRLAKRENVRFFQTADEAKVAGFRACKKCRPDQSAPSTIEAVVHELCRYIEDHADAILSLADIAKKSGYSVSHIQKAFLAIVGSSPKVYQAGLRRGKLKDALKKSGNTAEAIYAVGYGSSSRVYEKLGATIGMTPRQYRKGGEQVVIHYAGAVTSLGIVMIAATERGICFLQFGESEKILLAALRQEFPRAVVESMPPASKPQFAAWMEALNRYLDGKKNLQNLPLDIRGTAFQMLVWRYLQAIPAGEVRSYTEVAVAIGKPRAVRAVASACANNRIAIAIPCHRVLRGDGALAGYRWGLERKRALIDLERRKSHD